MSRGSRKEARECVEGRYQLAMSLYVNHVDTRYSMALSHMLTCKLFSRCTFALQTRSY